MHNTNIRYNRYARKVYIYKSTLKGLTLYQLQKTISFFCFIFLPEYND